MFTACQMPFRSGLPSAVLTGAYGPLAWPRLGTSTASTNASTAAATPIATTVIFPGHVASFARECKERGPANPDETATET